MYVEKFPKPETPDYSLLAREDEKQVLLALAKFQAQFERAVDTDEPSTLISCILNFAGTPCVPLGTLYSDHALLAVLSTWLTAGNTDRSARVLIEGEPKLAATRLELVRIARINIAEGLRLVGLKAPQRM